MKNLTTMIRRSNRRQLEATATHEQLVAMFAGQASLPRRRWRVESSRAGNSRLLSETAALLSARTYGGIVVEAITAEAFYTARAANFEACPTCKSGAGKPCRDESKKARAPHRALAVSS